MKYLKLFNEQASSGLDDSDLQDIDDMFKEVADKYNFTKLNDMPTNTWTVEKESYCIKLNDDRVFIYINLSRRASSSFNSDIEDFLDRLEQIGYRYVGPEDSGQYQGLIALKITIGN